MLKNPESFDGKSTSAFNVWWESVLEYIGFYPETLDAQKIAWVGTLLLDTAKAWHQHRRRTMVDRDTGARYTAAIRAEFRDPREAANAQLKLRQLRNKGDIKAYFPEFRTLNVYARATGVGLREKLDQSMTDNILDMHFAHYMEEFIDDENFLVATYNARLHVERRKALKAVREVQPGSGTGWKDGPDGKNPGNARKGKESGGPKQAGSLTRGARLKSQGNHGRRATGEVVVTPTKGSHKTRSTPTGTAKPAAGGVAGTATPPRTATPEQRARAQSYRKSRSRQAQSNGKGKGVKMPRSLQPPNKPNPPTSKSRTKTCGKPWPQHCSQPGKMTRIFRRTGLAAPQVLLNN